MGTAGRKPRYLWDRTPGDKCRINAHRSSGVQRAGSRGISNRKLPLRAKNQSRARNSVKSMVVRPSELLNSFILLLLLSAVSAKAEDPGALRLEKEIPLPGVEGRIDHFSADEPGQRLFVAALGNGSVEIVDLRKAERTAEIKGLEEPQGLYYDSGTGRLYVATGGDGKLRSYDGRSLALQETLELGSDADNVRFDQQAGDVWVGYGDGIAIIDSAGQKVGSIALGSHPESFQFEVKGDQVYVNVPKQLGVALVDRKKRMVLAKWGLGASFANYPMALDSADQRLFVGCRLPARLVVLDTASGRTVDTLPTVGDSDDIFYDPTRRLVYVIGGEDAVEILRQRDPDHYERAGRITTAPGARTGFFSQNSSRLYVAVPHRGAQSARLLVYEVKVD
jgi:DNA-binding beta-propeller fold protein YncE